MNKEEFDKLKIRLSVESKNGIDFIIAATVIWALIAFIWNLDFDSYYKSILVFIVSSPMIVIAFFISKFISFILFPNSSNNFDFLAIHIIPFN